MTSVLFAPPSDWRETATRVRATAAHLPLLLRAIRLLVTASLRTAWIRTAPGDAPAALAHLLRCPSWCDSTAGHPWEAPEQDGTRHRVHYAATGPSSGWSVSVVDTATPAGVVTRGAVEVSDPVDVTDVDSLRSARRELDDLLAYASRT